ncbi:hypothetical protein [Spirosoma aerolatum]|uniref:hypothetical protein n=1 Tax=Spirosoma aerolatum TaxID=1211326 RepID=UPI0014726E39|nr:hypothetical protein [Spirosoma aerolatum]
MSLDTEHIKGVEPSPNSTRAIVLLDYGYSVEVMGTKQEIETLIADASATDTQDEGAEQ